MARNNWVEFNHHKFYDVINNLIGNEFGDTETYVALAKDINSSFGMIGGVVDKYEKDIIHNNSERKRLLSPYNLKGKFVPDFEHEEINLPAKVNAVNDLLVFQQSELDRIKKYYKNILMQQDDFYDDLKFSAVAEYKKQQKIDYNLSVNSHQIKSFIRRYESLDELKLVPKAKIKLKNVLAAEEKRRQIAAEKERLRKHKEQQQQLTNWRANVKVGDETFCGPVIAVNQSMIKIAVKVQLQGYSNEAWLRRSELYPETTGCLNRNGVLYPRS